MILRRVQFPFNSPALPHSFAVTKLVQLGDLLKDDCTVIDTPELHGGVISIGNFDGVHEGHAALLNENKRLADKLGGPSVAVVLSPHPAAFLRPDKVPSTLTWMQRRADLMLRIGVDFLAVCPTSTEFLALSANDFFQRLVVQRLRAKGIVEGPNFFFGKGREGNVHTLKTLCDRAAIELTIVQPETIGEKMISSTRIRGLLQAGEIETAVELLGQPYQIRGTVIEGEKRGRQIGFPTANLGSIDGVLPGPGVYGGFAHLNGSASQKRLAAIHIGPNPTFDASGASKTEVHLLDHSEDLYGRTLLVDFVTCVRDIKRFDSVDQLKQQLTQDIQTIRNRLTS